MRKKRDNEGSTLVVDAERVDRYKRDMARDPNELAKYQEALTALEAAESLDRDDRDDIHLAMALLLRIRRRRSGQATPLKTETPSIADSKLYAGLSVSEAAAKYLLSAGKAQKAMAIVEALEQGGLDMNSASPTSALNAALKRRAQNYDDVLYIARGTWTHRDNLTAKEKATLEHKARTSRGMAAARQRGVSIGGAPKITPEIELEMESLIEDGWSITDIAKRHKVSAGAVRLRFRTDRVKAIRKRGANKARPSLTLVESEEKKAAKA